MAVTNRKLCYFVVWTPHGKVIDIISFDDILWKDITEKLIAFVKIFILEIFSENSWLGLRSKMSNNEKKNLEYKLYFCQIF